MSTTLMVTTKWPIDISACTIRGIFGEGGVRGQTPPKKKNFVCATTYNKQEDISHTRRAQKHNISNENKLNKTSHGKDLNEFEPKHQMKELKKRNCQGS